MDYAEYGGSVLLGLDGTVVKAHGGSNARAFYSAIRQAKIAGDEKIVDIMRETVVVRMSSSNYFPRSRCTKVGMASDLFNEDKKATNILNSKKQWTLIYWKRCLQIMRTN